MAEDKQQEAQMEDFEEKVQEVKTVRAKTAKEMKAMCKPKFQKEPQNYYPTKVFSKYNFTRHVCKCGNFYWRHHEKATTCGDPNCVGVYTFIGKGAGIGAKGKKLTYAQAWETYQRSFTNARVPCHSIKRYPVVARWRNDVDYVAAGIFCFQPYCVTGELEPPANPLIQPQFCVRFNDLDNIGLTGRHYSGFIMLGCQVFNYPDKYVFFDEETVEFHLNWLIDELQMDLDEVTLIEDVWSGGGNLGSSIEIFAYGLEIGNMVFTRFKYFPDGSLEELDVKVIDVGVGLERIPWIVNGTATSYLDVFPQSLAYLQSKLEIQMHSDIWEKLGPFSCQLNIDEVENIEETWKQISQKINIPVETVKTAIIPVKELYIVLDHTRTALVVIQDGSLPSNIGGGSNIRNVIRRVFAIMQKNGWWEKIGKMEGFLELFEYQKKDLATIYGDFPEYKSFKEIISLEYERWTTTDVSQKLKLDKLIKKNKTLTLDDWILAVTSYGIPADFIAQISGQPVPGNLYYELAYRQEKVAKAAEVILYQTAHLKETVSLYFNDHKQLKFNAKIVELFNNIQDNNKLNIVITDQSSFYPSSGGQQHDTGLMWIDGEKYIVSNVEKVGKAVLHILDRPLPKEKQAYIGQELQGEVDEKRRRQLRNHHTATHIIFAACRHVLGPHVWQHGAKKTVDNAHLDITHYSSLTKEIEMQIENEANRIILSAKNIKKGFMDKAQAEKQYGFRLYQGGIVPGNSLRVVNIEDTDVEACCGTHCDNTTEVGWIKMLKTTRISDGILRLYYVAGEKCVDRLNTQQQVINDLSKMWSVHQSALVKTAERFFKDSKSFENLANEQRKKIFQLQTRYLIDSGFDKIIVKSNEDDASVYFSFSGLFMSDLKAKNKGIAFIGENFIFCQFGSSKLVDSELLQKVLLEENEVKDIKDKDKKGPKIKVSNKVSFKEGKKNIQVDDVLQLSAMNVTVFAKTKEFLTKNGFKELDI